MVFVSFGYIFKDIDYLLKWHFGCRLFGQIVLPGFWQLLIYSICKSRNNSNNIIIQRKGGRGDC